MNRTSRIATALACCSPLILSSMVTAQETGGPLRVEEMIVTAQKRESRLLDTPLSVTTLGKAGLDIYGSGGPDILFLDARAPSLATESSSGRTFPRFYIRGLGNTDFDLNSSQPVSLVYDGIVLENPILKGFPVFDVERVEVLRGPQGTVFGRNTPAGVVKFTSARPTDTPEAYSRLSYGRFNLVDAEGAISGPLGGGDVTARLSGQFQRQDNYVDNTAPTGEEDFNGFTDAAARLQLQWQPTPRLTALLNLHGRFLNGGARTFRANLIEPGTNDVVAGFDRQTAAQDARKFLNVHNFGTNLRLTYSADTFRVVSLTGYETVGVRARGDIDGGFGAAFAPPTGPRGGVPFSAETQDDITDHAQITQEVRIESRDWGRLSAQAGAFFFYENLGIENLNFDTLGGGVRNGLVVQSQDTTAWGLFAAGDYAVTDRLTIGGGVRLSGEEKDFTAERLVSPIGVGALGPIVRNPDTTQLSWDATIQYRLGENTRLFGRAARSFRAPSIQGRLLFGDTVSVAQTEDILSFEAGVKSRFWEDRAQVSLTGFTYSLDNPQLTAVGGETNFNRLINAEESVGRGIEAEAEIAASRNLTLTAGMSYNFTEIQDEDLAVTPCAIGCTVLDPTVTRDGTTLARIDGNALPQAPRWIANWSARYNLPLSDGRTFYAVTDWIYKSEVNLFLYESVEFTGGARLEGGVRVGMRFANGRYDLAAYGRNILDDTEIVGAVDFNNFTGFLNNPAIWGVEATARF